MPTDASPFVLIVPAAGLSRRFGAVSKLQQDLQGQSVLARAIAPYLRRRDCAGAVVATNDADWVLSALGSAGVSTSAVRCCAGGQTRAHSVLAALREVEVDVPWVAVHDGARPLVSDAVIEQTLSLAREKNTAAAPALAVPWTIKQASGPLPALVQRTVPRAALWAMQTPQVAPRATLLRAFESCPIPLDQVTDDVQLLELAGQQVWLAPGDERNLKITTQQDLRLARLLLESPGDGEQA